MRYLKRIAWIILLCLVIAMFLNGFLTNYKDTAESRERRFRVAREKNVSLTISNAIYVYDNLTDLCYMVVRQGHGLSITVVPYEKVKHLAILMPLREPVDVNIPGE